MKAKIYYTTNPDPRADKWWYDAIFFTLHFQETNKPISFPKSKFSHYFKLVSEENITHDSNKEFERIFEKYNIGNNPLSTPSGQDKIRKMGIHHTSMSVGDVINVGNRFWIVAGEGFRELKMR